MSPPHDYVCNYTNMQAKLPSFILGYIPYKLPMFDLNAIWPRPKFNLGAT